MKRISRFLPLNTLDEMYKALVRSHLDYCDIIYHVPSTLQGNLNCLMGKGLKEYSIKQLLLLLEHGEAQVAPNCMKN